MIGAGFADGLCSAIMVTQASRWKGEAPVGAISLIAQAYKRWELVMVTADPCPAMLAFANMVERATVVHLDPGAKMGALRQAGVEMAAGDFVATWDDDDWSSAFRLGDQIEALRWNATTDACLLSRMTVQDEVHGRTFTSPRHTWEPTMVARRESLTDYTPDRHKGEDAEVVSRFARVVLLERPELFTYRIHDDSLSGKSMADEWWRQSQAQTGGAE